MSNDLRVFEHRQSDIIETDPVTGIKKSRENHVFIHMCHVEWCHKVASFGYNVDLRRGKLGIWACAEHRAELEVALKGDASVRETGEPGSDLGSGRLF